MMDGDPIRDMVMVLATGREGRVIERIRGLTPESDLYRIVFEDGSTELFERDDFIS